MKVVGAIGPLSVSCSELLSRLLEYPASSPKQLTSNALSLLSKATSYSTVCACQLYVRWPAMRLV